MHAQFYEVIKGFWFGKSILTQAALFLVASSYMRNTLSARKSWHRRSNFLFEKIDGFDVAQFETMVSIATSFFCSSTLGNVLLWFFFFQIWMKSVWPWFLLHICNEQNILPASTTAQQIPIGKMPIKSEFSCESMGIWNVLRNVRTKATLITGLRSGIVLNPWFQLIVDCESTKATGFPIDAKWTASRCLGLWRSFRHKRIVKPILWNFSGFW